MTVVMVMFFALADRDDAAVRHLAHLVLELDGRVIDAEVVEKALFDIPQDAFAHRRRNVGDRDVA